MRLSVIICTYNPRKEYLDRVLQGLRAQTLDKVQWELVVIDNKSNESLAEVYNLSWHARGRVVREEKPGLAHARIRGVQETSGEIIVFVDDDNVLAADYLAHALRIMKKRPHLGSIGGKAIPEYEVQPPGWFKELGISLGCRDLGDQVHFTEFHVNGPSRDLSFDHYPAFAPIGTGMVIRRSAFLFYSEEVKNNEVRKKLGRTGKSLLSGEDNDIVLTILKGGWDIGYFPELSLAHIIPDSRLQKSYLERMAESSNLTWVIVLDVHGIRPWPAIPHWSKMLRKIKAFYTMKAWLSVVNFIRWKGICGRIEGQSQLTT